MTSEEIRAHLWGELLPLWLEHGIDRDRGGFHSQLSRKLEPAPSDHKRLLVQTRMLHTFSEAFRAGAGKACLSGAEYAFAFLIDRFRDRTHGGFVRTTTHTGDPLDPNKDCYEHAFVLLALASFYRAAGNSSARAELDHTLELVLGRLSDRTHGGFFERASPDWTPIASARRQNPHMHLFEALLAVFEATGASVALECARELLKLLRTRFIADGFLREHYSEDWSPAPGPLGRELEPGHHCEWAFLLREYARIGADASARDDADALLGFAVRTGVDGEHGGVYDAVDPEGVVLRDSKRLWPQTEYVRALATSADAAHVARSSVALSLCFERYVDPRTRGWREQANRRGEITSEFMNATSVYHVYGALSAVAQ